jgi:hypothetical protein
MSVFRSPPASVSSYTSTWSRTTRRINFWNLSRVDAVIPTIKKPSVRRSLGMLYHIPPDETRAASFSWQLQVHRRSQTLLGDTCSLVTNRLPCLVQITQQEQQTQSPAPLPSCTLLNSCRLSLFKKTTWETLFFLFCGGRQEERPQHRFSQVIILIHISVLIIVFNRLLIFLFASRFISWLPS